MRNKPLIPPAPPKSKVLKAKKYLEQFEEKDGTYLITINNEKLYIPSEIFNFFVITLADFADGRTVFTANIQKEISTGTAAKILKCSRVHIVNMMNKGDLNFTKIGKHRRVLLKDILDMMEDNDIDGKHDSVKHGQALARQRKKLKRMEVKDKS